jgi:sulfite reductase (NADPH) flavoprotein alpha-component
MPLAGLLQGGGIAHNGWVLAGLGAAAAYMLLPRRKKQFYDTGFDSFLKEEVAEVPQGFTFDSFLLAKDERDSCDFSTFLKGSASAAKPAPTAATKAVPGKRLLSAEELAVKKRVIVMFGTEYGFAKEIAEKLCEQLEAHDCIW